MRSFTNRHLPFAVAVLVAFVLLLIFAGCAVDRLRLSMDRGVVHPKVGPTWLDTGTSTNIP